MALKKRVLSISEYKLLYKPDNLLDVNRKRVKLLISYIDVGRTPIKIYHN